MNDPYADRLIEAYLDQALSEAELQQFEALVRDSAQVRQRFWELAEIHGLAGDACRLAFGDALADAERPATRLRFLGGQRWWAVGAGLAAAVAAMFWLARWAPWQPPAPVGFATIAQAASIVTGGEALIRQGDRCGAERIELAAGSVEVVLDNGVAIVFEGPGGLELLSPVRAFLHAGQVCVRVPDGMRGFSLDTPAANMLDLGTECAVKAGAGLVTEVQVYEGEVAAMPRSLAATGQFSTRIKTGSAMRFLPQAGAPPEPIPYAAERFIRRLPADKPVEHPAGDGAGHFNAARFEAISAPRRTRAVTIDGNLDDWPAEFGFRRDQALGDRESAAGLMMYDDDCLYIAAHIGDPAPLRNVIDPQSDGEFGWRGGGLQIRLSTDRTQGWPANANAPVYYTFRGQTARDDQLAAARNDRLCHLTFWQHAPTRQACLHAAYGMDYHGGTVNPAGVRGAFGRDADGQGYTLEYAIPWSVLHAERDPPQPGDKLPMSWTFHWGDDAGRQWRGQLVEIRNQDEPQRIHTWERAATWGRAEFE